MSRRVVVTGLGAVTPIGNNVDDFWTSVKAGKIGFDHITKFDTTDYKCHIAAELKDFNPHTGLFLGGRCQPMLPSFLRSASVGPDDANRKYPHILIPSASNSGQGLPSDTCDFPSCHTDQATCHIRLLWK